MSEQGYSLEVETRVAAPPETVFAFFVDPEKYERWMGLGAELDPRPGGSYRVAMRADGIVRGEYLELDPPNRVVFTWGWEDNDGLPPGSTTVEVTFVADGDDTLVRLRHSAFPDEASRDMHLEGWPPYMERLRIAAPGGDAGPDPNAELSPRPT